MNQQDIQHFKKVLLGMKSRLEQDISRMVEAIREDDLPPGEHERQMVRSEAPDKEVSLEANEEHIERLVAAALRRIDEGTFGRCQRCGRPIARQRLQAIPYAPYCIDCERQLEAEAEAES